VQRLSHFTPEQGIQYPLDRKLDGRILCTAEVYFDCVLSVISLLLTLFRPSFVAFKNSVLTSQKMQYLSSTNTNSLMLFRKTVSVYPQKKHFVDTKCRICYRLSSFILVEFVNV